MKHFKYLILLFITLITVACNQEPSKPASAPKSFRTEAKTPLEKQIDKVTNTVIMEPLSALQDDAYFYREKHYLSSAFDGSTQKDIFFSCDEFKKSLLELVQTDYSSDFVSGAWQRTEVEKLSQDIAKKQCANIYTLRANFLADLQNILNSSDTKDIFMEDSKPIIESYAKSILSSNEHYTDLFNKVLVPYKKLRQTFYPLEKDGYGTYFLEQNAFKKLRKAVTPIIDGKDADDNKINNILNKAQEEEKVLYVFLKKYESLTQTNGECINQFFPGLKEKWYDFMYEIEQMPAKKRQEYADKRFKQANDGLNTKCVSLLKKTKKQSAQIPQEQSKQPIETTYQEENTEEVYDF